MVLRDTDHIWLPRGRARMTQWILMVNVSGALTIIPDLSLEC